MIEQKETFGGIKVDFEEKKPKYCPIADWECPQSNECAWWISDSGKEECAIVKLAKRRF